MEIETESVMYANILMDAYLAYNHNIQQHKSKLMKRSAFIKMLMEMPGEDPLITFTCDHEEVIFDKLLTDYDVTVDENIQPISVPAHIDIRLEFQ